MNYKINTHHASSPKNGCLKKRHRSFPFPLSTFSFLLMLSLCTLSYPHFVGFPFDRFLIMIKKAEGGGEGRSGINTKEKENPRVGGKSKNRRSRHL